MTAEEREQILSELINEDWAAAERWMQIHHDASPSTVAQLWMKAIDRQNQKFDGTAAAAKSDSAAALWDKVVTEQNSRMA